MWAGHSGCVLVRWIKASGVYDVTISLVYEEND